jgi:molybdopterin biosynthesis enzyme
MIPTGDELIQPGEEATPGAVIDFNPTSSPPSCANGAAIRFNIRARDDLVALESRVPGGKRMRFGHDHRRLVGRRA